jgi:hypothetical protein
MEPLCQLVGEFSDAWEKNLRQFIDDERRTAINSVMGNRNRIAHGESTSLGFVQLKTWYEKICEVIEFIDNEAF